MEFRDFLSLTDDEVRQVVTDMFEPKKVTCIKRSKKWDEITCKVYTEWEGDPETDEGDFVVADELTLKDPFVYGAEAISIDFSVRYDDYKRLKQFCVSKGIYPEWYRNNPYIKGKKERREK